MLSSPKGGVGKSSLSRNILVLAAQAGKQAVGVDLDRQATLKTWSDRRERARADFPALSSIPVFARGLEDWRPALADARASGADFIVIDTPPSVEIDLNAMFSLSSEADLILVPSGPTQDDVDSVAPWMRRLREARVSASFVLNRANRRTRAFGVIRAKLMSLGPVCPVEIPLLEEIPFAASKGLGVMDLSRASSTDTFEALWAYIQQEATR
jgi:chromosome partitioning protein